MLMYLSIYFQAKLNEPGINLNGFLFKLAGKTYTIRNQEIKMDVKAELKSEDIAEPE